MNKMKLIYFLLCMSNNDKIIQNFNIPTCKNCVYYKKNQYDTNFDSNFNRCTKFGYKEIITGKISHDFASYCRNDETKCGKEGKYFKEEKNLNLKILNHRIIRTTPYHLPILILALNLFFKIFFNR